MPPSDPRFFLEDWIITLPSHPDVKFVRLKPLNHGEQIKILSDPLNSPFSSPADLAEVWDAPRIAKARDRFLARYRLSKTKFNALDVIAQIDGQTIGNAAVMEIPEVMEGLVNVGLSLDPSVRGRGLGKAFMQLLLRLSNEMEFKVIHAGTMKANKPMRAIAKSLDFKEREELLEVPGRGVVAEILFEGIDYKRWKDLEMNVEFKGPAPE